MKDKDENDGQHYSFPFKEPHQQKMTVTIQQQLIIQVVIQLKVLMLQVLTVPALRSLYNIQSCFFQI